MNNIEFLSLGTFSDFAIFCVHESVTPEELLKKHGYEKSVITDYRFNGGQENGVACSEHSDRRHWRIDLCGDNVLGGKGTKVLYRKSRGRVYKAKKK